LPESLGIRLLGADMQGQHRHPRRCRIFQQRDADHHDPRRHRGHGDGHGQGLVGDQPECGRSLRQLAEIVVSDDARAGARCSLQRLRVDAIDLFYQHRVDAVPIEESPERSAT